MTAATNGRNASKVWEMTVIIKKPEREPVLSEIEDSLSALQEIVGGYIEHLGFDGGRQISGLGRIGMLMDEEGKFKGYAPNFAYYGDFIVGTVIFVGEKGCEFVSLSEKQQNVVMNYFTGR